MSQIYHFVHKVPFGSYLRQECRGVHFLDRGVRLGPNDYLCKETKQGVVFQLREGPLHQRGLLVPWGNIAGLKGDPIA